MKDHGAWLVAPTTLHSTRFRGLAGGLTFAAVKAQDTSIRVQKCAFEGINRHVHVPDRAKASIYTDAPGVSLEVAPGEGSETTVYSLEFPGPQFPLPTDSEFVELGQVQCFPSHRVGIR
jgi:hypothetical protein